MFRRFAFVLFAAAAMLQTGCCGRVHAFFYRLTHCDGCCTPYYGSPCGCAAPVYSGPSYAPGCATCAGGPVMASTGYPMTQPPVFNGMPQPMPGPSVYPTPPANTGTAPK